MTDGNGTVENAVTGTAVRVGDLAYARSGDKADTLNVGVVARSPAAYRRLGDQLTAERVADVFAGIVDGDVTRYELPGLQALNFVCTRALDGGGQRSLRYDSQGKTYGAALLRVDLPPWEDPSDA